MNEVVKMQAKNPYGLRPRQTGFYVLVWHCDGTRTATRWTSKEGVARDCVSRQGHYGVRMARAESVELVGGNA